jgi:hypothetical protein
LRSHKRVNMCPRVRCLAIANPGGGGGD